MLHSSVITQKKMPEKNAFLKCHINKASNKQAKSMQTLRNVRLAYHHRYKC